MVVAFDHAAAFGIGYEDAFEAVLEFFAGAFAARPASCHRAASSWRRGLRAAGSPRAPTRSGFSFGQALAHRVVEHEGLGDALVDPRLHLPGGRRPAQGVGDVRLDLAHAFVAVLEQSPRTTSGSACACGSRAPPARPACARRRAGRRVSGRRCRPAHAGSRALGHASRPGVMPPSSVEVGVDRGHAELDRLEVLVGELHALRAARAAGRAPRRRGRRRRRQSPCGARRCRRCSSSASQRLVLDEVVDVGAVRAVGIAEDAQRGGLEVAARAPAGTASACLRMKFGPSGSSAWRRGRPLRRAAGSAAGSRSRKMPDSVITTSMRGRPS